MSTKKENIHCQSEGSKTIKRDKCGTIAYVFVCHMFGWEHLEDSMNNCCLGAVLAKVLMLAYVPLLFGTGRSQSLDICHKEAKKSCQ